MFCFSGSHIYCIHTYIHTYIHDTYIHTYTEQRRTPSIAVLCRSHPNSQLLRLISFFCEEWDLPSKIWLKPLLVPLEDSSVLRFSILWIPAKPSIKQKPAMEIVENTGK